MPFAASNPHFYGRFPNELTKKLDGFKPDRKRHQSFIIVEPIMGVPIDQSARSQSNVIIPNLRGFSEEIQRFSNMALPTFWVEYVSINRMPTFKASINLNFVFTLNLASKKIDTTHRESTLFHIICVAHFTICNHRIVTLYRYHLFDNWGAAMHANGPIKT